MEHNKKKCVELVNKAIREFMLIYRAAIKRSGIAENEFRIWYTLIVMGRIILNKIFVICGQCQSRQ